MDWRSLLVAGKRLAVAKAHERNWVARVMAARIPRVDRLERCPEGIN